MKKMIYGCLLTLTGVFFIGIWELCEVVMIIVKGENGLVATSMVVSLMIQFLIFWVIEFFWVKDSVKWVDYHQRKIIIKYVVVLIVIGICTFVFAYADYSIITTGLMYLHLLYYFVGIVALVKWLKCRGEEVIE